VVVVEIIATGDHIWLDAIGGLVVASLGFASARATHSARRRYRAAAPCSSFSTPSV
jgi:hypothetical protein